MCRLTKYWIVAFITGILFLSCEKDTFTDKDKVQLSYAQRQELWDKFRPSEYKNVLSKEITPRTDESQYPTQSLLLHIANELQKADSTSAFLEDMVTAFGLPLWNYSIIKGSESSDCVVSIPFDRITSDTSISGILKYYKFDDVEELMFVPKTELDSLVQTTLDTVAYDGYLRGILHDLVIFEFNLFRKLNLPYFNFVESGHHLQPDQLLPRSRYYCIYRFIVTENIQYVLWPDGSQALLGPFFAGLVSSTFVGTSAGPNNTSIHIYEDCYYIRDPNYNDPLSAYSDFGSNWRDWSAYFEWYLNWWNSQGSGTSGGSGSGGNGNPPPPPPPTPVETCLAGNLALSASADYITQNLVNPCNPIEDLDEVVTNALSSACDLVQGNMSPFKFKQKQIQEFHSSVGAQLGIDFDMLTSQGLTIENIVEALPNLSSCCGSDFDETCAFEEIVSNMIFIEAHGDPALKITDCFDMASGSTTQSVTLYVDQPKAGHDDAWVIKYYGVDPGHTFLSVNQTSGSNKYQRIIGYYPFNDVSPGNNESPGIIQDDNIHTYDVSITIPLSSSEFNALVQAIDYDIDHTVDYDLDLYNCSDWAIYMINGIGSFTLPECNGTWPGGGGTNPGALGQYLRTLTLPSGATKNTDGGSAPVKNCN